MLRQRRQPGQADPPSTPSRRPLSTTAGKPQMPDNAAAEGGHPEPSDERQPLLSSSSSSSSSLPLPSQQITWLQRNQWVALALASGACAAFNGVFAKLTTTELTGRLSQHLAVLLGLASAETAVEVVVRGTFFGLNVFFNGVMWTLFTRALARGHSATQVSVMNTSCNFVLTALLGLAIFGEALPPLWWAGASLLVAGNVIIGRKDESQEKDEPEEADTGAEARAEARAPHEAQQPEDTVVAIGVEAGEGVAAVETVAETVAHAIAEADAVAAANSLQ